PLRLGSQPEGRSGCPAAHRGRLAVLLSPGVTPLAAIRLSPAARASSTVIRLDRGERAGVDVEDGDLQRRRPHRRARPPRHLEPVLELVIRIPSRSDSSPWATNREPRCACRSGKPEQLRPTRPRNTTEHWEARLLLRLSATPSGWR